MVAPVPPRIYCIPATAAPVVAVFRRGPSAWAQVGRWNLQTKTYEPGAWLRGRLFPRRCDLSPDGQFLCYFAHQPSATWAHGATYVAVSKLPWLTALHAFGTDGTWTRGYRFTTQIQPSASPTTTLPIAYDLAPIPVVQFAGERQRGWQEAPDSPPRHPRDIWDERRNARLQKRQPLGEHVLCVESLGQAGGEFGVDQAVDGCRVLYSLESQGQLDVLADLQWADWARNGDLLVATRLGQLQVRRLDPPGHQIVCEIDLSVYMPHPCPAPQWAQSW